MFIFGIFLGAFMFTMLTIFPNHPAAGPIPLAPDFINLPQAGHALLVAGLIGEPI